MSVDVLEFLVVYGPVARQEDSKVFGSLRSVCDSGLAPMKEAIGVDVRYLGVPISHDPLRIDEWLLERVKKHEPFFI